ncbi:MAG: hemagglutinin repeat-containing protein [Hydrogenophaga sp.]|nr:hemagglutinin repeat-containing protein [Hydrogenophaga sp.]
MNRRCHRVVFNAARGLRMAVAECARALGTGTTATATVLVLAQPANAQILRDPTAPGHQQPVVLPAGNGVPVVHITTPSAAGVSRNTYRQFDVGPAGAILNNAPAGAGTRLGGTVPANPWLAGGSARVILNEVNSALPSQLRGFIEVAGARAEVVIANPSGIAVNGGGFINASRATLTTGTPQMAGGALDDFAVRTGTVRIEGTGLDATEADHAQILARAVELNATVWARDLTLVSGANNVSANGERVGAATPTGPVPRFALDVAALGGMYADKIRLIGTEAGLGVNHAGLISAQGELTLAVNGRLSQVNTARTYGGQVSIAADAVLNEGRAVVAARDTLTIETRDAIVNRDGGLIFSGGDMALAARGRIENRSASVEALGHLAIDTPTLFNTNEHITHTITEDPATQHTEYFTPGGVLGADDVAWSVVRPIDWADPSSITPYNLHGRAWLLPATSAWADPAWRAAYLLPAAYSPGQLQHAVVGDSDVYTWIEDRFHVDQRSTVWARFGMATPAWAAPGPAPRATRDSDRGMETPPDPQLLAQWQMQAAPWLQLNERIASLKAAVNAELRPFDVWQQYSQVTRAVQLGANAPARIASGGDLRLRIAERFVNQDSEVLAGAGLFLAGTSADNRATSVNAATTRSGTVYHWGVVGRDCWAFGCDPEYGWVGSALQHSIPAQQPLPALRFEGHSASAPTDMPTVLASALFAPATQPEARYLIETDPRFTGTRQWLGSDHLLAALGADPSRTHKRLGDGFAEQRLVREQVVGLTGQRFLGDHGDDEAQYRALLNAGATFAQAHGLRPGVALTGELLAVLTSDIVWLVAEAVTLPDGRHETALVPRVYLAPRSGDLSPAGSLMAAREVHIQLGEALQNSGTIAGSAQAHIAARNIHHSGQIASQGQTKLQAAQDIAIDGAQVTARDALTLAAGRDIHVTSTRASSADGQVSVLSRQARMHASAEAGALIAKARRDITLTAAQARADALDLHAGRDLRLDTVQIGERIDATRDERNFARVEHHREHGSQLAAQHISLSAGQDIGLRAVQVQSEDTLHAQAGRDLNLVAGQAGYAVAHSVYAKGGDMLGSTSTETRSLHAHTQAQGSELGARHIRVITGRDLNAHAAQAVADDSLTVDAGRDLNVLSERTEQREERFHEKKASGVFGSGGGVTLGRQQRSTESRAQASGATASTFGVIDGNVHLKAARHYTQRGSDVLAPGGDVNITAQHIAITEARAGNHTFNEDKARQGGISFGVSSPVIDAMQSMASTIGSIGDTQDGRMRSLGVATLMLQGHRAYGTAKDALKVAGENAASPGVGISISVGASSIHSTRERHSDHAQASQVQAAGDINLTARGAGEGSDILVQGSDIHAGRSARLAADGDIHLQAARNEASERTRSNNQSASIGIGFVLGGTGTGIGITASASAGKSEGDGQETTHRNTHISAGESVTLKSGNDTTLQGAVVQADHIEARVGGNLTIESLQDHSTWREHSRQAGVTATFGAGGGGSVSASKTRVESEYRSVVEQSGLRAGDDGFDVSVQGKTLLVGGAVTSSENAVRAGKNGFESAGGTQLIDVSNAASYQASGWNAAIGAGSHSANSGAGIGAQSGEASSATKATISGMAGRVDARTGDAETGIVPIFDAAKVRREIEAQATITNAFGQQARHAVATHASDKREALRKQAGQAATDGERQALQRALNETDLQERVLNVLIGAVTGFGGAALTQETLSAAATEMRQIMIEDSKKFAGVVDEYGNVLSNMTGLSDGVDGDGVKLGGTRVDLDALCGPMNERCRTDDNRTIALNERGQMTFTAGSIPEFLKTEGGKKMVGLTGGVQGFKGTLFGVPYEAGSWQDKLIESFAGPHDHIGGSFSGLYDEHGNAERGRGNATAVLHNRWSEIAIPLAAPFSAAHLLPPDVWNAISILIKGTIK